MPNILHFADLIEWQAYSIGNTFEAQQDRPSRAKSVAPVARRIALKQYFQTPTLILERGRKYEDASHLHIIVSQRIVDCL